MGDLLRKVLTSLLSPSCHLISFVILNQCKKNIWAAKKKVKRKEKKRIMIKKNNKHTLYCLDRHCRKIKYNI